MKKSPLTSAITRFAQESKIGITTSFSIFESVFTSASFFTERISPKIEVKSEI
jgi:hypothetical protein